MNWLEMLVSAVIGAVMGLALQLLVDQIVLKGKIRKAAMDGIKFYIPISKWRVGDDAVVGGDGEWHLGPR